MARRIATGPLLALSSILLGFAPACGADRDAAGDSPPPASTTPVPGSPTTPGPHEAPPGGTVVSLALPQALQAELDAAGAATSEVAGLTAEGFAGRYPVSHVRGLGYDPTTAAGLDVIQASNLGLTSAELEVLRTNGFVISRSRRFPTFAYGYSSLYADDLPLYVSADSILDAVHRSYDNVLQSTELEVLIPELQTLLGSLRTQLGGAGALDATVRADLDVYLAVALGLLTGRDATPVAGGEAGTIDTLVADATAASDGIKGITLFGVPRKVDVSQFVPRGHYTDTEELKRYFRAMMWLGRIDFRLVETNENGSQVFHRRQFDAMVALHSLFDAATIEQHRGIDSAIEAFVGESDNMKVSEVAALLSDLGASPGAASVDAADAAIAQAILDGGYGAQRIMSDLMINSTPDGAPLPLHRTFMIFGQRYTVDSHVFSNVVYDRVPSLRMMPNPLDVAFAAFGNDDAGALLAPELAAYEYAPALAEMRILVDGHDAGYWDGTLYTTWLLALRALSPGEATADPAASGLPLVTGTEPWGRRILSTQLGSWAQLRHDTILYVKQSYTGGSVCEFPDAYVDPYPEFFAALERLSDQMVAKIVPIAERSGAPGFGARIAEHQAHVKTVMTHLRTMAEHERSGTPFTAEQMTFINEAVTVQTICGRASADGWYPRLVFGDPTEFDPTIADVHTQPYGPGGGVVGNVLHVGTGYARYMVVTANTCSGPRAYAGLASSYFEKVTKDFERLTDPEWQGEFLDGEPSDVPWLSGVIAP